MNPNWTMKLLVPTLVLGFALSFSTSAAHAQDLPAGHWEGTITGPDGTTDGILLMLSYRPDGQPVLEITRPGNTTGMFGGNIEMDSTRLFFSWNPGTPVFCSLHRQEDNSLEGTCLDAKGAEGQLKVQLQDTPTQETQ